MALIQDSIRQALSNAYNSSRKKKTSSTDSSSSKSSSNIGVRDYFENRGYKVDYDTKTGNIRVYDPKTGSSAMLTSGTYRNVGGTATTSSNFIKNVENTIASGKYKLPGYGGDTGGSSGGRSSSGGSSSTGGASYIGGQNNLNYGSTKTNDVINSLLTLAPGLAGAMTGLIPGMAGTIPGAVTRLATESAAGAAAGSLERQLVSRGYLGQPQYETPTYDYTTAYNKGYQDAMQLFEEFRKEMANADVNTAPLYSQALDQFINTLDQYQAQIIQQMQQQMGGVDPATLAAIANLRETVKQQRENLMEEMSRRGLLQSGIWLEMESRINRGELTAQQQLLAGRLADLQNQLNQALMNFTNIRMNALQTYGLAGIQAAQQEALNRQQQLERSLQTALDEAYRQQQLALQQFQTTAPYMYLTEAQRQSLPLDWTQSIGEVAPGPGYQPVPVRSYVGSSGTVSYDSNTGDVIINGTRINPAAVGGYISNGTAYIPQNVIDSILNRY